MSTLFGTSVAPQRVQMLEFVLKPRKCRRCSYAYRELDNFGRWVCPSYHPSAALTEHMVNACCGRPRGSPGCVAADHSESGVERDDDASTSELTSEDVLFMASVAHEPIGSFKKAASWRLNERSGRWRVARCDLAARARALARAANQ